MRRDVEAHARTLPPVITTSNRRADDLVLIGGYLGACGFGSVLQMALRATFPLWKLRTILKRDLLGLKRLL